MPFAWTQGSGKSIFCKEFVALSLKNKEQVIAVLTDESPSNFIETLKTGYNIDKWILQNKLIIMIVILGE